MVIEYIILGNVVTFTAVGLMLYNKFKEAERRREAVKNFPDYASVLQYHMDRAYDIIHKDRILIYSLEAVRLDDDQFDVVARDFLKLVLKMIGPRLSKELAYVYGDEDTLFFNIIESFSTKYEEDEIRKSSMDSIMGQEIDMKVDTEETQITP